MHEQVRCPVDEEVEKRPDSNEAHSRESHALPGSESKRELKLTESDSHKEGTDVRERGVLEEADQLGGAVAIDRTGEVVGIEPEIERVGNKAENPKAEKKQNKVQRFFGPWGTNEPGEGEVEHAFTG